jgi:shikimate dehydrogenase
MLISRSDLRLAITAGLATGFTAITPLAFGVYLPQAVLAVCTGTYGSSLSMARQRIAGTLLGGAVVLVGYGPMQGWPFPLAIAVALSLLRLLGGWLGIKGYKVGSFIVIMGWLVHNDQLGSWIPLRLFWTCLGILVAMGSLRLFWPSLAIASTRSLWRSLLAGLAGDLQEAALRIVDEASALARRIGAVNCIVVRADGSLEGRNYDAFGFTESLRERAPDLRFDAGPAVVIGAGGASRAILAGLMDEGVPEIRLINRSPARAQALAAEFGAPVRAVPWEGRAQALEGAAILVNTTSQGMVGEAPLDLALDALPVSALVVDIVYVPLETPLLASARARGNRVVDGLGMLLHQARPAFEAWFGIDPKVTVELRALIEATL